MTLPSELEPHHQENKRPFRESFSRRTLLSIGWIASLASMVGPAFANIRYLFPNVLYETPTAFKLREAGEYVPDTIAF